MAEIETTFRFFILNSDKIPTIHINLYDDIKCSLRIDKAEYVNNLEGERVLTNEELEVIILYLKDEALSEDFKNETQYSLCRKVWNLNHWELKVPEMEIPNYNILYKE